MHLSSRETDRRAAYRVRPAPSHGLSVALLSREQRLVPDEVSDVSLNGAAVSFTGSTGSVLAAGDRVSVAVESPEIEGTARVLARIVGADETPMKRSFHLLFEHNDDLLSRGSHKLLQLFNRRVAFRGVAPESGHEIRTLVLPMPSAYEASLSFPVAVRNLSTSGICLDADHSADRYLRERAQFQLSLTLPNRQDAYKIASRVCYRCDEDEHVYYGCRFDWDRTPESLDMIEDLTEYLLEKFEHEMPE